MDNNTIIIASLQVCGGYKEAVLEFHKKAEQNPAKN